jgi:4a-hydroxytetrahydrobiopterin dehydratase
VKEDVMTLNPSEIDARVRALAGWSVKDDALVKRYEFASFPDAIAFATRLAFDAESHDHHPDLTISYRKVTIAWSTHDEGGITDKDFTGAADAERIAGLFHAKSI